VSAFTFLVPSLCCLSVFKTLNSVFNTCHFINIFKTLHVLASIGHPQVLKKLLIKKIAVILGIHAPSSLCLPCALFLVVFLRACDCDCLYFSLTAETACHKLKCVPIDC
jgi:hypothetical protein